jgi:hypothetical protein
MGKVLQKKNFEIKVRLDKNTFENFNNKCKQLGINRTELIEKISNEPIAFFDKEVKKNLEN